MKTVRACLVVLVAGLISTSIFVAAPGLAYDAARVVRGATTGSAKGTSVHTDTPGFTARTAQGGSGKGKAIRAAGRSRSGSDARVGRDAVSGSGTDAQPTPSPAPPLRILFIGNSHTDRHGGMDWLVSNLVASEDPARTIETERLVGSGVTLEYHYRNGALRRIRDGDWDIVVLQEYLPGSPTSSAEPFFYYGRSLDKAIRDAGAKTVLYMTWPEGLHAWATLDDITAAHRQLASEIGAAVAPVGLAMARAHAERPDLAFLGPDEVHTTWEGAYLAAATIYAVLFERSPEGLPYHLGISDDEAAFLQRIAWETVSDWRAGSNITTAAADTVQDPATG